LRFGEERAVCGMAGCVLDSVFHNSILYEGEITTRVYAYTHNR
jgi:hypothetical protein